jgi:hypothetical protein
MSPPISTISPTNLKRRCSDERSFSFIPSPAALGNAEANVQAAIVAWIRTVAPELIVFHPPNGGLRGKSEAARLKWIGTLAGIPDL